MTENTQLAKREPTPLAVGGRGLQFSNLDEMWRFCIAVKSSGLAPKQFDSPEKLLIAIQHGLEIGLPPMQALQCICVINGRPSLYGDALPGLAWGSGVLEEFEEWFTGKPYEDDYTAHCRTKRVGQEKPKETSFSVAQAKKGKLWGKSGPWQDYPDRMLQMRARSWNFRDNLSDVLKGLHIVEEARDVRPESSRPERTQPEDILTVEDEPPTPETPSDEPEAIDVEPEPVAGTDAPAEPQEPAAAAGELFPPTGPELVGDFMDRMDNVRAVDEIDAILKEVNASKLTDKQKKALKAHAEKARGQVVPF